MFLALKEIKHEKLRYGLITLMIFLISYLIFMISALAIGLADENTQALESWGVQKVAMNKSANVNMAQSFLDKDDLKDAKIGKKEAIFGETRLAAKAKSHQSVSATFIGIKKDQFIYKSIKLASGHKENNSDQVVVDVAFQNKGYHLGDKIKLGDSSKKYEIVGFAKNSKINIGPIIYGTMKTWKSLDQVMPGAEASAIASQNPNYKYNHKNVKTYTYEQVANKLPGYKDQNMTFAMMIGFLFVISLIIIAVFMYILTMQKMHNFAVMRAQGIPAKTLVGATISQSLILVIAGVVISLIMMIITFKAMPAAVPMLLTPQVMLTGSIGMLVMGVLGSLIPVRSILKVDPASAIGE